MVKTHLPGHLQFNTKSQDFNNNYYSKLLIVLNMFKSGLGVKMKIKTTFKTQH